MRKWEQLPQEMRNESVRAYYEILEKKRGALVAKRCFDAVMSAILIVILSPVMLFLALWIKSDSKGPVFYRQERVTRYGETFRIFKFRTMVTGADKIGSLVTTKGDARITRVGAKIRHSRLDELPQVFNIFLGQMSFVGTRPEVRKYVDAYTEEMWATLLLPAGVTSLASIEYKEEDKLIAQWTAEGMTVDEAYISQVLPEKMRYNLKYLKDFSFFGDLAVCVKTVL